MSDLSPKQAVIHAIESALKSYKKVAHQNIKKVDKVITVDQASLLQLIKKNPEMPQSQIGVELLKDYAAITRMIDLLVKNKYVKRKENLRDRRRNMLLLTDKGEKTVKKLRPILRSNQEMVLKNFSNYELDRLNKLLERLIDNCKED